MNYIYGTDADDHILGTCGDDVIVGGAGNDWLWGLGSGFDILDGGDGDDVLQMNAYGSFGFGGAGNDTLFVDFHAPARYTLAGGTGADTFSLSVEHGAAPVAATVDILDFEAGVDRLILNHTSITSVQALDSGFSIALSTGETVFLWGASLYEGLVAVGPEVVGVTQGTTGNDKIAGTAGDDVFNGAWGDDRMAMGAGDDIAFGGAGADSLYGNAGDDTLDGGSGDDMLQANSGHDLLIGAGGNDTIYAGIDAARVDAGSGDDWIELRLQLGGGHVVTGGEGADTFAFLSLKEGLTATATITDYEIGTDHITIEGRDLGAYCLSHAATTCIDTAAGALLTLAEGDQLLFSGIDAATLWGSFIVPIG